MQNLMEVERDALKEDRVLNDKTLETKMKIYHKLRLNDVISSEQYLFEIKRSQICKSNGKIKNDLCTSNQGRPTKNNEFIDQISNEDLELIHKALVLLHVRSKTKEALEITKLLTKIAIWNENNIHSLLS